MPFDGFDAAYHPSVQQRIYLDHNATTPVLPAARKAWLEAQDHAWANPASVHREGQQARSALDQAKARIARAFACRAHELVLCSGGSEAIAWAIRGSIAAGAVERLLIGAGDHSAVRENAGAVLGSSVETVPVDESACMDAAALTELLATDPRPALVCLQFAHNESGALADLPALVAVVRAAGSQHRILLDACHGAGKRPINLVELDIDCAAFAGHKFGAPKGCGGLLLRAGLRPQALIAGGGQQQGRRSGSEDLASAAAMAVALEQSLTSFAAAEEGLEASCQAAWKQIRTALPETRWLAQHVPRLPGCMLLMHPGIGASGLLTRLDLAGFALSRGAACAAMSQEPSPALLAAGVDASLAASAIRVSAGATTSAAALAAFAEAYIREVRAMLSLP